MELMTILSSLNSINNHNEKLYNLCEMRECLNKLTKVVMKPNEHFEFVPYYIDNATYELYWCGLTIISVTIPSEEKYILEKTGKEKLADVPPEIIEREKHLYLEIIQPTTEILASSVIGCIDYIRTSKEVEDAITNAYREKNETFQFNENYLFFAIH